MRRAGCPLHFFSIRPGRLFPTCRSSRISGRRRWRESNASRAENWRMARHSQHRCETYRALNRFELGNLRLRYSAVSQAECRPTNAEGAIQRSQQPASMFCSWFPRKRIFFDAMKLRDGRQAEIRDEFSMCAREMQNPHWRDALCGCSAGRVFIQDDLTKFSSAFSLALWRGRAAALYVRP